MWERVCVSCQCNQQKPTLTMDLVESCSIIVLSEQAGSYIETEMQGECTNQDSCCTRPFVCFPGDVAGFERALLFCLLFLSVPSFPFYFSFDLLFRFPFLLTFCPFCFSFMSASLCLSPLCLHSGDTPKEQREALPQITLPGVLPIVRRVERLKARVITSEERQRNVHALLRKELMDAKLSGARAKRAAAKAEAEKQAALKKGKKGEAEPEMDAE